MGHDHSHDPQTYYVEQLCTIGICGALGGIAVTLYFTEVLWFVADKVKLWVVAGGFALLTLVVIRAIVVWVQAGRIPATTHDHGPEQGHGHDHAHAPGETCEHDHGPSCAHEQEHDHSHGHGQGQGHGGGNDHGHDHGWAPWRYVILLLPVVLFCLGLPNKDMKHANAKEIGDLTAGLQEMASGGAADFLGEVDFRQLEGAPYTAHTRAMYEGKTVILKGEFLPGNDKMFTLVRYKMNCCAADRVGLPAVIMLDRDSNQKIPHGLEMKWLTVQGQVHFQQSADRPDTWITIIVLRPDAEHPLIDPDGNNEKALIKVVKPDSKYYLS